MNAWANIEVSSKDSEISAIDNFEKTLGPIPVHVKQIRELITKFEVCHFKVQQHFKNIQKSILNLHPVIKPGQIGLNHLHKGENVWKNDKTGRSRLGRQYLMVLNGWLDDDYQKQVMDHDFEELDRKITTWLGDKNPNKKRLVRLLISRLTWNWKSLEEFQKGGEWAELETQICRMDICHYAFPKHLERLLQGIGLMKPVIKFEGCGSYNKKINAYISTEFSGLCDWLQSNRLKNPLEQGQNETIKIWLIACLAKTLKEQLGLTESIPVLPDGR
jgi:hypothetical protein